MKVGDLFSSDLLNAGDVTEEITLTIDQVKMVEMGNDGPKPAVCFQGTEKMLPLNKTNALALAEAYGEDTDGWSGKPVTLFTRKVEFRGKMVDGIRVRASGDGGDSDLPF